PVVERAVDPAQADFVLVDRARIGPIRRPVGVGVVNLLSLSALLLFSEVIAAPWLLASGNRLAAGIVTAVLVPGALLAVPLGRWLDWQCVVVDVEGVRWRRLSGWRSRLAWRDVRAFSRISSLHQIGYTHETHYVLHALTTTLAWRVQEADDGRPP